MPQRWKPYKKNATALRDFENYYLEEYKIYAQNFHPHITIARDMNESTYKNALGELLGKDLSCKATISQIKLIVVNSDSPEEANDPRNQNVYQLMG